MKKQTSAAFTKEAEKTKAPSVFKHTSRLVKKTQKQRCFSLVDHSIAVQYCLYNNCQNLKELFLSDFCKTNNLNSIVSLKYFTKYIKTSPHQISYIFFISFFFQEKWASLSISIFIYFTLQLTKKKCNVSSQFQLHSVCFSA